MKAAYVKTKLQNVLTVSQIVTVHYFEFDKNFVFNGESHDFWEMVYVDKGSVEVGFDGEKVALGSGGIIFHAPNEFHTVKSLDSDPNFLVLTFVCKSPLTEYFRKYHTVLDKTLRGFISSIIKEAESAYEISVNNRHQSKLTKRENAPIGSEQLIKTYLEQFLILLIRNIVKEEKPSLFPTKESMETHLVRSAKEIIAKSVKDEFHVSDLCQELGYSKSYLSKRFHEQTGETIASFATKEKIKHAKRLIREGCYNFSEIAYSLAFDNPQYFSRVFKRVTGMTPTEFKTSLDYIT